MSSLAALLQRCFHSKPLWLLAQFADTSPVLHCSSQQFTAERVWSSSHGLAPLSVMYVFMLRGFVENLAINRSQSQNSVDRRESKRPVVHAGMLGRVEKARVYSFECMFFISHISRPCLWRHPAKLLFIFHHSASAAFMSCLFYSLVFTAASAWLKVCVFFCLVSVVHCHF